MKKNAYFLLTLLVVSGVFLSACNEGNTNKNDNNNTTDSNKVVVEESESQTFYLVPSPKDIFGFTEDESLGFNEELLNPTENTQNYIDTKSKELNFGIYSADLAYAAAFEKSDETVNYLSVVRTLSDEIGISAVFNESLTRRIENLTNNKDSLIVVSSDTYFDIIRYLEKKERVSTLAYIATGGWLESLYIVVNLAEYEKGSRTMQAIADQKIVFTTLMMYLEQNQEDEGIQEVIDKLTPVKNVFEQLEVINIDAHPETENNEKIIIGRSAKISITQSQFEDLKKTISDVRNKYTGNSVE